MSLEEKIKKFVAETLLVAFPDEFLSGCLSLKFNVADLSVSPPRTKEPLKDFVCETAQEAVTCKSCCSVFALSIRLASAAVLPLEPFEVSLTPEPFCMMSVAVSPIIPA